MFDELLARWHGRPIANCPGRFVLTGAAPAMDPRALLAAAVDIHEYRVPTARDLVVVAAFDDGGLISYRRADGSYLHTLNTPDGFARKLQQLGIQVG